MGSPAIYRLATLAVITIGSAHASTDAHLAVVGICPAVGGVIWDVFDIAGPYGVV